MALAPPSRAGRMPVMAASGRSGRLTLRMLWRGRPRSMTCPTIARRTGSASSSQPGSRSSTEKASAGCPRSAASKAAPTVPEYVTSAPMLPPALTPETTRSGTGQRRPSSAMRTQSDGVPSQARPS